MTLKEMLEKARAALTTLLEARKSKTDALTELRAQLDAEGSTVTREQVESAIAERDALDPKITEARARVDELTDELARDDAAATLAREFQPTATARAGVTVGSEPDVYRKNGPHSYFRDLHNANTYGRRDALERLHRNDEQVMSARALTLTDGSGGELVPPIWIMDELVALARPGRVVADRLRHEFLPSGTDSISLPRIVTGTSTAEQTINGAFSETDLATGSATSAVTTVGGVQKVPLQLVEQSPLNIDNIVLGDLAADYARAVDVFCISNNAANKRGLLNVTGINAITYTDASPTVPEVWPKLIDASRQVATGRLMPAREVWMNPTRWAWFQAALDANNRPFVSDSAASAIPLLGQVSGEPGIVPEGLAGTIRGLNLPIFVDPNIPVNLGAGTNEDRIIVARPDDVILFEGSLRAESFRETLAANGQVLFRVYAYLALMSERAPKAISVISGTGLVQPTF